MHLEVGNDTRSEVEDRNTFYSQIQVLGSQTIYILNSFIGHLRGPPSDCSLSYQPQTQADNIIYIHFLKNYGVDGKIYEEQLFILNHLNKVS
jgi:hypothetical protein